jgi:phospholipid/cholesterol/gamma-HCH transport system ATP-binding protein
MSKNAVIIDIKNMSMKMKDKFILKNVNLKIKSEESIVFIGPSGSGKTILLKLIAGIYAPTNGKILVDGDDYQLIGNSEKFELAKKLGMLFQQGGLFDRMTVLENVEFPLQEHFKYPIEKIESISRKLLKEVNLLDSQNKLPSELSGGMQRRLGIARALALNPKIVFYDDPVAGQDPVQKDQMLTLISNYKKENKSTLIMVTSSMKAAYRIADRIIMIIDQEVIDAGTPKTIMDNPDPRIQQFINGNLEGPIKSL